MLVYPHHQLKDPVNLRITKPYNLLRAPTNALQQAEHIWEHLLKKKGRN
jgi:hypothetical protein